VSIATTGGNSNRYNFNLSKHRHWSLYSVGQYNNIIINLCGVSLRKTVKVKEQRSACHSTFHNHNRVFNNDHIYPKWVRTGPYRQIADDNTKPIFIICSMVFHFGIIWKCFYIQNYRLRSDKPSCFIQVNFSGL
jgi:hypothetical protein